MMQKIFQRIWALVGAVSARAKILGEEQSVSVVRNLAAHSTDPILLNDLLGLHDLLDEPLAKNPNAH